MPNERPKLNKACKADNDGEKTSKKTADTSLQWRQSSDASSQEQIHGNHGKEKSKAADGKKVEQLPQSQKIPEKTADEKQKDSLPVLDHLYEDAKQKNKVHKADNDNGEKTFSNH
eukprot:256091-Ditylum_brightwellii.AAC.1